MTEAEPEIRKDLLFRLYARKALSRHEFLAGREWQYLLEAIQIQGWRSYDWSTSIFAQQSRVYQSEGGYAEFQEDAYDTRRLLLSELGKVGFADLDRLLSVPDGITVRLSDTGAAYVARLLQIVSVALSIQAGGTDFGAIPEDWERKETRVQSPTPIEYPKPG